GDAAPAAGVVVQPAGAAAHDRRAGRPAAVLHPRRPGVLPVRRARAGPRPGPTAGAGPRRARRDPPRRPAPGGGRVSERGAAVASSATTAPAPTRPATTTTTRTRRGPEVAWRRR